MNSLNIRNKKIQLSDVKKILEKANISENPNDITLYQQAFTHKSYTQNKNQENLYKNFVDVNENIVWFQPKSYETLEFYGDSIIASSAVEYLFKRYPQFEEGELTKLKNKIVSSDFLSNFAKYYGFQTLVLLSNSIENIYGRDSNRILEDCFEAFTAAIALDINYSVSRKFVMNSMDNLINFSKLLYINENYKDRILNFFQLQGWNYPKYEIDMQLGPQNKKTFVVNLLLDYKNKNKWINKIICKGIGKTKKSAEMNASYNALLFYGLLEKHEL